MLGSDDARQAMVGESSTTFSDVVFHIIESGSLDHERAIELRDALHGHGGTQCKLANLGGHGDWHGLTHIVAATIDFDGYDAAEERMLAVVRPKWVDDSLARHKLANPRSYSPDPRLFFAGLLVCTAGLPEGDKDAVIGGVLAMGGMYSASLTRLVTHLVAPNMDAPECRMAADKGLPCKIVLPHWFNDCLRLGRRISERPYLLPDPEVLRLDAYDKIQEDTRTSTPANGQSDIRAERPSSERQRLNVFDGKKVLLGSDLQIGDHLQSTMQTLVEASHGSLVSDVKDADVLICQFRDGSDFKHASAQGRTIGSLAWFYHVVTQNAWSSPLRKLLHYPAGRNGIPGFQRYRISLSNYSGGARTYLENLAKAAGCEFTRTMKQTNTHLITAHQKSEKCEAAREWNVHIVNHLWLEESYAKWQIQSVADPRYSCFPPRTNLGEVVGMTPIDKTALGESAPVHRAKDEPSIPSSDHAMESEVEDASEREPSAGPTVTTKTPLRSKIVQSIRTKAQTAVTPARAPRHAGEKENESPPTTGRRGAAEKAAARLHELAPDIALYEKEKKRVGGGSFVWGGRPTAEEIVQPKPVNKKTGKRKAGNEDEVPRTKKTKTSDKSASINLLVTGHSSWNNDSGLFRKEKLLELGISVTPDPLTCTHLAAPKVLRTPKFICAMARAPVVVHLDFIEACLRQGQLATAADYPLDDEYVFENGRGEERSMQVSGAVELASEQPGNLFRGQQIFVADAIDGGFDAYNTIIGANGGRAVLFKGRQGPTRDAAADADEDDAIEDAQFVYLVSGGGAAHAKLGEQFEKMAQSWGKVARVVTKDWVLLSALSQEVQPSGEYSISS